MKFRAFATALLAEFFSHHHFSRGRSASFSLDRQAVQGGENVSPSQPDATCASRCRIASWRKLAESY